MGGRGFKICVFVCALVMLKTATPNNFAALPTCATGSLNTCGKDYFYEVAKVKLILVMPATNLDK